MIVKDYRSIHRLKHKWNELYFHSKKISNPFQTFITNRIFFSYFHLGIHRIKMAPHFIYAKDGSSELLFPVIEDKKRKRITEFAPLDYYDILSSGSMELVEEVVKWLKNKYPNYVLIFSRVNQSAFLFSCPGLTISSSETCVAIPLECNKYDDYYQSLSKHQRQNLRSAYNKLGKANISISLSKYDSVSIKGRLKRKLLAIYEERKATKSTHNSVLKTIYSRFSNPVFKIMTSIENGVIFVLYFEEEPVAVMAGALSRKGETFVVPILYSNNKYLSFSPGIILLNEVVKVLIEEKVTTLDLARGEEPYKYAMGGQAHLTYRVIL